MKVYPQLKYRQPYSAALSALEASRNCTCAGTAGLANEYLGLDLGEEGFVTHHKVRMLAGDPRNDKGEPRGLGTSEAMKALTLLNVPAKRYYGESFQTARDALMRGSSVGICVHYPVINAYDGGKWSGQLTFKGEHFLVLKGWTAEDPDLAGRNSTTDHDSLFDGRTRTWGTAPLGPQVAPFSMFRAAMGKFLVNGTPIGTDKGVFIVVDPAPPPPPPPETPEEIIARLTAELDACRAAQGDTP